MKPTVKLLTIFSWSHDIACNMHMWARAFVMSVMGIALLVSDSAAFCGNLYPNNSSMYMPTAGAPWPGLSASLLSPYAKSNSYPNMASPMSTAAPLAMADQSSAAGKQGFNGSTTYPAADCYTGCDNTSLSMLHDKINMQNKVGYGWMVLFPRGQHCLEWMVHMLAFITLKDANPIGQCSPS